MTPNILLKNIPYSFCDSTLLDNRAFINGEWMVADDGRTFPVYDPEDNQEICHVANLGRAETKRAIEAAQEAFQQFRKTTNRERRWLIRRWADLIRENKNDLAAICTLELGKPFTESLGTVKYGTDFLDWFESCIEQSTGQTIPAAKGNNRIFTIKQPQGVVAAITPWNSPVAMITRKVGAAIAAGNTVVCKPAPETPLCAIAVAKLFERAGGPPGVLNIITSDPELTAEFGDEVTSHPLVRHVSFTGSTAVGRYLHAECAKTFKKTSMELGGNAPFIIFDDADISSSVDGLIASKFRSSGQTCVCANRVFVHSSIMDSFASTLAQRLTETFRYGSVWDHSVNYGPLYSGKAMDKIRVQLDDALRKGAKVSYIGSPSDAATGKGPNFCAPTVITRATPDMLFMQQETFGPLAFLVPFQADDEVVALANKTNAGLASYIYTENISRVWKVSEALESGMVGVRVGLISACEQPFGGIKDSGVGREGGMNALDEYLDIKSITLGI
ncbi:Aldehyde/histidinol dehydrogenase [Aspergillus ambiguus]|uniref:NAD-dependent succinate-semialdehyde dehydrogenase n=1 Tax=Aspergillus ambiguus TaxID=176160 RepID=UPI003CCD7892